MLEVSCLLHRYLTCLDCGEEWKKYLAVSAFVEWLACVVVILATVGYSIGRVSVRIEVCEVRDGFADLVARGGEYSLAGEVWGCSLSLGR